MVFKYKVDFVQKSNVHAEVLIFNLFFHTLTFNKRVESHAIGPINRSRK